jgi:hypothetical protein
MLKIQLLGGQMSLVCKVGLLSETFDGSKLDLEDSSDPAFSTSQLTGNSVDLGVGLYYTHGPWYAGASVQHANAPLVNLGEKNELQIDRTYYLTGGYNIKMRNPFLTISPRFWIAPTGGLSSRYHGSDWFYTMTIR